MVAIGVEGGTACPTAKTDLKERLARYRQIKISAIGRKSGRTISLPIRRLLLSPAMVRN